MRVRLYEQLVSQSLAQLGDNCLFLFRFFLILKLPIVIQVFSKFKLQIVGDVLALQVAVEGSQFVALLF